MEINNNIPSYQSPQVSQNRALERIATGLELNRASDNAASLAISDNLRTQASGYSQSIENANSALASVQISDKAISEQSNILDQIKEKLLQASTDTTSQDGRDAILKDIKGLAEQFDNIASSTNYNGQNLLQASSSDQGASQAQTFQVGTEAENTIALNSIQSNTTGLGINELLSQDPTTFTANTARGFLENVDQASTQLNDIRAEFGSTQNQIASAGRNLIQQELQTRSSQYNLSGANIAQEVANFDKQNVLSQVGAYTQSQFNVTQQSVLRLLT